MLKQKTVSHRSREGYCKRKRKANKNMKELKTISAETLIATPFEPRKQLVSGLIGEGITIIGGPSKSGKSWMMLRLCLSVAEGLPFLDMETEQAEALYLCLEDNLSRLQDRLFKLIQDAAPESLHFAVRAGMLGSDLEDQIRAFKSKHPALRLVIIDTLQMIRTPDPYRNAYADDYKCLSSLKELADSMGLSIVLVHHLRKLSSEDPFDMLTGSTGLQGASDAMIVLKREREQNTATLYITGRDLEQQKLKLQFMNGEWSLLERYNEEEIRELQIPDFIHAVVAWVPKVGWEGTATALLSEMQVTDVPTTVVTKLLNQHHAFLQENGIVYGYRRTRDARLITLQRVPDSEGSECEC